MSVTSCKKHREYGTATLDYRYSDEEVTEQFIIKLSASSDDWPTVLAQAQALSSSSNDPPPGRGDAWPGNTGYGLYAKRFQFRSDADLDTQLYLTVTYLPIEPGEGNPQESPDNPLLWPTEYDVQYIEEEFVVEEARNLEAFTGQGHTRAANTLGPIVNSALDETEEPLVDTERVAVVKIIKNVPSLDAIVQQNDDFARTTNTAGTFLGLAERKAKFIGAESGGRQVANGIEYYPMITSVAIYKTTDRIVNNVGWNYIDNEGNKVKCTVEDDDGNDVDPANPLFLDHDGSVSTTPKKITYRYLEAVSYASLL